MAIVEGIIVFGFPLADLGIGMAIIQEKNVSHKQLSTLYWINIFLGVFVFIILMVSSPFIADFYAEPDLTTLLRLVSLIFLVSPLGAQFNILFQKNLVFSLPVKIDFISNLISFVTAISLAFYGFGVYSLVYARLVRITLSNIITIYFGLKIHKPGLEFDIKSVRSMLSFGTFQMGERYFHLLAGNVDKLLIGKLLGSEQLGYYNIAHNLVVIPMQMVNPIVKIEFCVCTGSISGNYVST